MSISGLVFAIACFPFVGCYLIIGLRRLADGSDNRTYYDLAVRAQASGLHWSSLFYLTSLVLLWPVPKLVTVIYMGWIWVVKEIKKC